MEFTLYSHLGEIQLTVGCPKDEVGLYFKETTVGYLEGYKSNLTHYVDVALKVFKQKSLQTSQHHIFNYVNKQWEDLRTLQDLKDAQWSLIKQARSNAEYAGFTWDGSVFDSDAISQNRITGAVTLAQLSTEFTIDWILKDNTVKTLAQMDTLQVGAALGSHVATVFAIGVERRNAIELATTKEKIEAIIW